MKNLKKLSRTNLKEIQGGGKSFCGEHLVPGDQFPEPGMPYTCGCSNLAWCPSRGACVHPSKLQQLNCEGEDF
ncbi:bacteriocin-like protein [Elizabethkingia anophelis]|uniref:bacteriocin-like protein n=1 Tax=Elizabethkingia anophelis TaxID=1117645 RepID=UPI003891CB60